MPAALVVPFRKSKGLQPEAKHNLIWGWFRLVLGLTQMSAAAAAILTFFAVGLEWRTWALMGIGLSASVLSRWIYRGR